MTADEPTITAWLHGVTHKPGWEISYGGVYGGKRYVMVLATGRDSNDPSGTFEAMPLFQVPEEINTRTEFLNWLLDECLPGIDAHERCEWFRVDGKPWRDPHAPGMPAFTVDWRRLTFSRTR